MPSFANEALWHVKIITGITVFTVRIHLMKVVITYSAGVIPIHLDVKSAKQESSLVI